MAKNNKNIANDQTLGARGGAAPSAQQAPSSARPIASSAKVAQPADAPAKSGKKRTLLIALGIVVAAVAVWLLVWLFACNGQSIFDPNARTGQAPYKTQEEMQAELDRVVEEGMFNISIASAIEFEDGGSSGTAYIENVPGNRYDMQVTITDDDSGEVLYESGILKPNQYIENITLAKHLDAGKYNSTAMFTALDPNTHEEKGAAAAKVLLNVLK